MSVLITRAGLQTTIQASPRTGQRHLGIPTSGPADALSMALANHLVGNSLQAPALEVTLTGIDLVFENETRFAITGAPSNCVLSGAAISLHHSIIAAAGDDLHIGAATSGARVYISFGGGLVADEFLGSGSTYVPAGFGGYKGRLLQKDDRLELTGDTHDFQRLQTPAEYRPPITGPWAVRACVGAEFDALNSAGRAVLFDTNFIVGARNDRMGLQLQGRVFDVTSAGFLASVPVFPGSVQCPEDGSPYLLAVDAQTTGGYPRIAQVARVDRHVLGQLRAGDHLRLLQRTPELAVAELREKLEYWREWLPDIKSVV